MAVLQYGVSVAEASPGELAEDFGRQAKLLEEAEARGISARIRLETLEVLLDVEGDVPTLVSLAGWALGGDVCWPDRLQVEGAEDEAAAEAAVEGDRRTKGYMEVVRVA